MRPIRIRTITLSDLREGTTPVNFLERFIAVMEYKGSDRVPNWECGVWEQTKDRWVREGLNPAAFHWDWILGEEALDMDPREYVYFDSEMLPRFDYTVLENDQHTTTYRDSLGRVRRTLTDGASHGMSMSMDNFLEFPVRTWEDWQNLRTRFDPRDPRRREPQWLVTRVNGWKQRIHPLIFGTKYAPPGFYWHGRDLMGTEGLSFALFEQPKLIHDIIETRLALLIEGARPVLEQTTIDYVILSEDMSMKTGPLLSPEMYREYIYPRMKRLVEYLKSHGTRYVAIDTDGNPEALIPLLLDAGVDALWPCERAADQDPVRLRKKFGRSLRLWGGVDKRVLAQGPRAIDEHLRALAPLIEEGGFIPTVDHMVPPDVSWSNFQHYMRQKSALLAGTL